MTKQREKYTVNDVDLFDVRNRNEQRVAQRLSDVVAAREAAGNAPLTEEQVGDIYAHALNTLPARYAQAGTIVLREPVRSELVRQAVDGAVAHVLGNPKKQPGQ